MIYSDDMRRRIGESAKGKVIESLVYTNADGGYWVMTFTDGSEICVRLMAELCNQESKR